MRTTGVEESTAEHVTRTTRTTLETVPARLMTFIQGMADPAICARLTDFGWSTDHCREGIGYLHALASFSLEPGSAPSDALRVTAEACLEVQGRISRARGVLSLLCPTEGALLFAGFVRRRGIAVITSVYPLVERIRRFCREAARAGAPPSTCRALQVLEDNGLGEDVLAELVAAIDRSRSAAAGPSGRPAKGARTAILQKAYAWLAAWSIVARGALVRRDQLIRLGLATRRAPISKKDMGETRAPARRANMKSRSSRVRAGSIANDLSARPSHHHDGATVATDIDMKEGIVMATNIMDINILPVEGISDETVEKGVEKPNGLPAGRLQPIDVGATGRGARATARRYGPEQGASPTRVSVFSVVAVVSSWPMTISAPFRASVPLRPVGSATVPAFR